MRDGEGLEQTAHLPGIDQARHRLGDRPAVARAGFRRQQGRARADAETFQERGLRDSAMDARAGLARRAGNGGEIDMGGEVGSTHFRQGIAEFMRLHGLQRIAGCAGGRSVVDEQGRDALLRDPRANRAGERQGSRTDFRDLARLRPFVGRLQQTDLRPRWQQRPGQCVVQQIDSALAPALLRHLELMDRQRIQELVGDNQGRPLRQGHLIVVPQRMKAAEALFLHRTQGPADLHQMQPHGGKELRPHACGTQRVRHQAAAAGAQLHQQERIRRARFLPGIDAPQADQLAEHLADLRRGDEVARTAERIARRVIARALLRQRDAHELRDGDRPARRDPALEEVEGGGLRHVSAGPFSLFRHGRAWHDHPRVSRSRLEMAHANSWMVGPSPTMTGREWQDRHVHRAPLSAAAFGLRITR